ncbi:MAG: hypothetical protein COB36_02925 [Alphaproteobacteria bacterium]|nr:MAG: hypothetical protein COB36_02925 [Alphaproteobacteria bacterium]
MSVFRILFTLICVLCFSTPSKAETGLDVLNGIVIEGIGLMSDPAQIQTSIDNLKSKEWACQETKIEERDGGGRTIKSRLPRRYGWDCRYQDSKDWQHLIVAYLHDRVVILRYDGSKAPRLEGAELVSALKETHQKLQKTSDLPESYNYKDYAEIFGASSQVFKQSLNINLPQICIGLVDNDERPYRLVFQASHEYIPSQKARTVSLSLSRADVDTCIKVLRKWRVQK